MVDIFNKSDDLIIQNSDKKEIRFNRINNSVLLDTFDVTFPWEYEKSGILLEVKEYNDILFYNFLIEWKHLVIISNDDFEMKEEILSFFWDVDILIIIWSKKSAEIFENIEARIVIPYWDSKWLFLNTLWQHIEEIESYRIKSELPSDLTEFVNLV